MEPQHIARRHKARAGAALEIGRYAVAEKEARAALAIDPRDVDGNLYLTRALIGMASYDAAERAARGGDRGVATGRVRALSGGICAASGREKR